MSGASIAQISTLMARDVRRSHALATTARISNEPIAKLN
jgi:hypothetical protein